MNTCTVERCTKPLRSRNALYCDMHYSRVRRHGTTEPTRRWNGPAVGPCPVDGCGQPQSYNGMCGKHATRVARHGNPHAFTHQRDRNLPRRDEHPLWTGEDATYTAVHQRVRKERGRASTHPCAGCGQPARHWSYDHSDPNERISEQGAYSIDPGHYLPLCVSCHKKADLKVMAKEGRSLTRPIDMDAIRQMHTEGVRVMTMAKRLGVSRKRIDRALDAMGLPHFPRGGRPERLQENNFPAGDAA